MSDPTRQTAIDLATHYTDLMRRAIGNSEWKDQTFTRAIIQLEQLLFGDVPAERLALAAERYAGELDKGGKPMGARRFYMPGGDWEAFASEDYVPPPPPVVPEAQPIPGVQQDYRPEPARESTVEEAREWKQKYKREVLGE